MTAPVDGARLEAEIEELARFSDTPYPSVTRVLFTEADLRARAWLTARMEAAGLAMRVDAVGNIFGRWEGSEPDLPAVATGSHIDAIPDAGRFDGVVGVLGGLEAVRALAAAGHRPRRAIELIVFTAEEPTRFAYGCLGSRVLAGTTGPERLARLRDAEGLTFEQVRAAAGMTGPVEGARLPQGAYAAFVELHIEQGPELERGGVPIGVVTAIAAPSTLRVELAGEGGHAGAVLMPLRHDPLVAAAEVILAVDREARGSGAPDTVGTVGLLSVEPGAVNSIPRSVRMDIDIRDTDLARRDAVLARVREAARAAAAARGVSHRDEILNADDPAASDPAVLAAIERSAAEAGLGTVRMISRAYHDCVFMARICPAAMIFVPSRDGVSHRPDEYTSPREVAQGAQVLAGALARLSA
ncbi:MAG: M20 family metallo-hydrolase [Thermoleophilia bacterium]